MKYTNQHNISTPMALWLASDDYDYQDDPNTISVTTLMNSTREVVLTSRIPVGEGSTDIATLIASRLGTAIHDAVEKAWLSDPQASLAALGFPKRVVDAVVVNPESVGEGEIPIYLEQRTSKQIGKWNVSGKYDMIFDGTINDIKSTKIYTYTHGTNDDKYVQQLSIYRWLNPDKVTSDVGKIQYLFTDWQKHQAHGNGNYPKLPLLEYPVNLMSITETDTFVKRKLQAIELNWHIAEPDLPQCTSAELWQGKAQWKYFGKPDAVKASKVFDNSGEAYNWQISKGKGYIREFPATPTKCLYCSAMPICSQAQGYVNQGILPL